MREQKLVFGLKTKHVVLKEQLINQEAQVIKEGHAHGVQLKILVPTEDGGLTLQIKNNNLR